MKNKQIAFALLSWLGVFHFHLSASAQPVATTLAASGVTTTNATLKGTVNPNGAASTAYFQYGLTISYGSFTVTNSLAAGNTTLSVSNVIRNLAPGTTYHFRIVGVNSFGTELGTDLAFTTTPVPPTVTTLAASGVTATNATLNGTLTTGGLSTQAYFRYGLTTNYGSFTATNSLPGTNTPQSVSTLISGLLPATTYHFQLVGSSTAGVALGTNLAFTTPALLPVVTTLPATSITGTSARLNGTVNPGNGMTTVYFKYGLTTSYGSYSATNSLAATNTTLSVSNLIGSLAPGTTYHFQLVGTNTAGTSVGVDLSFTTSTGAPVVTTLAASDVTGTDATLNGTLTTGGLSTKAYFRYGLTTNYGSFSATNSLTGTNTALSVSNLASLLTQGSTYHFQLVASNSAGTAVGGDVTLMTLALLPIVTTVPATSITTTNATLNGTVNPMGGTTTAYFQYGLTTSYGYIGAFTVLPAVTNSTLTLPGFVCSVPGAAGATWTQSSAPTPTGYGLACSADGTRLAGNVGNGRISVSTNSGASWTQTGLPFANWRAIASSSDGSRLAAVANAGYIWISTNSGGSWTQTSAPLAAWYSIASSADGTRLVAGTVKGVVGGIYTSTDGGVSWTQTSAPNENWTSIASSADGMRLAATLSFAFGSVWLSTNGGVTWNQSSAAANSFVSIASSADGTKLAAVANANAGAGIFISTNSGLTWTKTSGGSGWSSIACSADGTRLAAVVYGGGISTSTDGGATWTQTSAPNQQWTSIATSADGTQLAAMAYSVGVWTSIGAASDLTPGTVYHYRLVGINSAGTSLGSDLAFTTAPIAPLVSSLAASGITGTNATLNGAVNPFGAATKAYFRYGLTTNYGSFSATNSLPGTNATLLVSNLVRSLTPVTTYHYQVVGINSVGTSLGVDRTFTTTFAAPAVVTLAASSITASNAVLNGTVNPKADTATAYFQYGLTTNYGSFTATNSLAATNTAQAVSHLIGSLTPGATYHFRSVGVNSGGTVLGVDLSFTTRPLAPTLTTSGANSTATNATLVGIVNPGNGVTTVYAQYGLTTNYGGFSATNTLTATNVDLTVFNLVTNLAPGTTYHFRLVAFNSAGTSWGDNRTFTTRPAAPIVTTLAASGLTATNATLNGTVNPGNSVTTAYFQYGLTTNYGSYSATNTLTATNVTLSVSNLVSSLAPGTTYHFRLVAFNGAFLFLPSLGGNLTFTTSMGAPVVTTLAASDVTATNGTLKGTINPNGAATTAYFQYGLTTGYGSYSTTNNLAVTNTTLSVSNLIASLVPGTTYHFRLVAANSAGTVLGSNLTFTTVPLQPVIPILKRPVLLPDGTLRLSFTNLSGLGFIVRSTTNAGLPLGNWTVLGAATEVSPGQYQFTDTQATNKAAAFYRVQSSGSGRGWSAQYFKDATNGSSQLVGAPFQTRTDATINFNAASGWPNTLVPGLGSNSFSVRWSGQFLAPATAAYTFYTRSDDGVRLHLNGQTVINNWTTHTPVSNSAIVTLQAGQFYPIVLEYFQNVSGAEVSLEYEAAGVGLARQIVPAARVF